MVVIEYDPKYRHTSKSTSASLGRSDNNNLRTLHPHPALDWAAIIIACYTFVSTAILVYRQIRPQKTVYAIGK